MGDLRPGISASTSRADRRSRPFRINVFITPAVRERGYISSSLPRRAPLGSFSKLRRPIGATMGQQRPGHAHHLVGERHRHDLEELRQELRNDRRPSRRMIMFVIQFFSRVGASGKPEAVHSAIATHGRPSGTRQNLQSLRVAPGRGSQKDADYGPTNRDGCHRRYTPRI